jgi:hypothetical protein
MPLQHEAVQWILNQAFLNRRAADSQACCISFRGLPDREIEPCLDHLQGDVEAFNELMCADSAMRIKDRIGRGGF